MHRIRPDTHGQEVCQVILPGTQPRLWSWCNDGPAREQFNGEGSLGNGGAMRVAPIALFYYKNSELMVDTARKQSHITHTHKTGVDGAILQAIAIQQSLLLDPKEELDTCKFTDNLINEMDKIEIDEEGLGLVDPSPYKTQLKLLRNLICEDGDGPHDEKVVHQLGNDVSALHSVPTAIYCFLKAQKPIPAIQTENPLRRTVQYAVSKTESRIPLWNIITPLFLVSNKCSCITCLVTFHVYPITAVFRMLLRDRDFATVLFGSQNLLTQEIAADQYAVKKSIFELYVLHLKIIAHGKKSGY
ncbi:ADP-ribose glycohydrolase ARH3-like isoform X2 [Neodiprion fabricii]|uniref:ADP-ribose glycohydrolase ARH3-like isoform X2 n=1 Tax=Neodiprion fabricii TaxID=2872261 RepID=UPI001ED94039|nr:ADP-ribose glycohydrolase ARH3-like isoform X2 [Neodiprion fabricii]